MARSLDDFLKIARIFMLNNYSLYLTGGTVRDFIITKDFDDYDLATDATPDEIKKFIPDADMTFAKYGGVKIKSGKNTYVITTFRKESGYKDSRHPSKIKFVKDMKIDVKRRDFTINALYMDDHFNIYDYVGGQDDIKARLIRMIGNPSKRIKEDPLRMIRAVRFAVKWDFVIEYKLAKAIYQNGKLIHKLNKFKIREELSKIEEKDVDKANQLFNKLNISSYIKDMLK